MFLRVINSKSNWTLSHRYHGIIRSPVEVSAPVGSCTGQEEKILGDFFENDQVCFGDIYIFRLNYGECVKIAISD